MYTLLLAAVLGGFFLAGKGFGWPRQWPFASLHARMDALTKATQQLQALLHVEGRVTREALTAEMQDGQARMQALMNKLMRVGETVQAMHVMHANLGNTLSSHQLHFTKILLKAKDDLQQSFIKTVSTAEGLPKGLEEALKSFVAEVKTSSNAAMEVALVQLKKDYGDIQRFLAPLQRNQEHFGTAMNGSFEQVLKELSNVAYSLSKQTKDLAAQLRWVQQTADRVQGNTEHLPDKLNFLRGLLEEVKEVVEGVQKELEHAEAEQGGGASPTTGHAQGQNTSQWNAGPSPQVPPASTPSGATMLNLDESLPVVSNRSYLCPITLPDGRSVFVPRNVFGPGTGPWSCLNDQSTECASSLFATP